MAIHKTHFRGNALIRGRPKEQAVAEIMTNKAEFHLQNKKRKRFFFTILDILALVSLGASIYSFYKGQLFNGVLTLIPAIVILVYFLIIRYMRNKLYRENKMNRKGDLRLTIGLITAASLILGFISALSKWSDIITGIFGFIFIISLIFWKFTR